MSVRHRSLPYAAAFLRLADYPQLPAGHKLIMQIFFNRLFQAPLLGALFLLFFQRLKRGPSGAQDRIGLTIENTTAISFVGLLNAMAIFPADRNLYLHEAKTSARYSAGTMVLCYTIVEVGFEVLAAFGYAALVSMIGKH